MEAEPPLITVKNVVKSFVSRQRAGDRDARPAVHDVSLNVVEAETLGIVGESGSGKSTLARLMSGLLAPDSGTVTVAGLNPAKRDARTRRRMASQIQMVFQDPYSSLNPRMKVGRSVVEPLMSSGALGSAQAGDVLAAMLEKVGISASAAERYPHEFSGGQRQRLCIARALILRPSAVILDEAVSALDVSVKSQILNVLKALQEELRTAYVFISHDLGITRQICGRVAVMLRGQIVESGQTDEILQTPAHPYTRLLVGSVLRRSGFALDASSHVAGDPPGWRGCPFVGRCPVEISRCQTVRPDLVTLGNGRYAACHHLGTAA